MEAKSSEEPPDRNADEGPDRARVAERLLGHRALLVSRIRRHLARTGAPASDAEAVLSTTLRRTDVLAAAGRLAESISDEHLLALATAVARLAAHEAGRRRARDLRRLAAAVELFRAEDDERPLPEPPMSTSAETEGLLRCLQPDDLAILGLRLRGLDWPEIAVELETTPAGAHRRYYRAMQRLSESAARES